MIAIIIIIIIIIIINKKSFLGKVLKGAIIARLDKKFGGRNSVVGIVFR